MHKRIGNQTVRLENPPSVLCEYSIAGKKEKEGNLGNLFDETVEDSLFGTKSWEKAESKFLKTAISGLLKKASVTEDDVGYIFAGDLLNQCSSSHFAIRGFKVPFFGLYGACSTMAESLSLAAMSIDGGFAETAVAATSSHFCSAEKQFRFPLEYGGQRPPTAQWTVTGSGAILLGKYSAPPYITHITTGKIVDNGICDANNMGAAMAPAAADTIAAHFEDTGFSPEDYDLIITGDLGKVGKELLLDLLPGMGVDIKKQYNDCGLIIYNLDKQDVHSGGSGCGCSAVTLCSKILRDMRRGELNNVLFIATGALMNTSTCLQGESIPCIAHAVRISTKAGDLQ